MFLLVLLVSCGGNKTYSPGGQGTNTTGTGGNGGTGGAADWTFVLGAQTDSARPANITNLGTLTNLGTFVAGQTVAPVNILAVSKNGFNGKVTLSDVASATAGHIAAVPGVPSIVPTVAGAPFSVSFAIPPTYSLGGSGVTFQGTDAQGRVKTAHIAFAVSTVSGAFAAQTFSQSDQADSGNLVLTSVNGLTGPIGITFDTNILSTDGANKGDLQLPKTVTVTAPSSPITLGATPASTPINFKWTTWNTGNYAVIAVLKKAGTPLGVRVPLEITITSGGGGGGGLPWMSTWQYGPNRDGAVSFEYILNQSNVNASTFGRLFTQPLDAKTEGQPLYLQNVQIKGATHNVVFVATVNNSVYAFDADVSTGSPLWKVNLGPAVQQGGDDAGNEVPDGILSTPVISFNEGNYSQGATTTGVIYVCAKTSVGGNPVFTLHGLDITTGSETAGGPVAIQGSVPLGGLMRNLPGEASAISLNPKNSYQRPALLMANNEVYVAIGGQFGDPAPDRGWVFAYNASNLQQQMAVFTTCPDLPSVGATRQIGGSIWMSAAGPSSDGTNIFVTTGNGDFNVNTGGHDYGDSIIKLSPSLQVESYFTPFNQLSMENGDVDLGSGGPVLIPSVGGSPNLIIQNCKDNEVYLANANSLGGFNAGSDNIYQELALGVDREYLCTPAYNNGFVYMARGNSLQAFSIKSGKLSASPSATAPTMFGGYLPTPVVSFNGNVPPIVWAIENGNSAILHAYAASNLHELYNSNSARDAAGSFAKFAVPTVISGKVYVPCGNELAVYGLLANKGIKPKRTYGGAAH